MGLNPGHHGQYNGHAHFDSDTYRDFVFYQEDELKWDPFWVTLSRASKRVIVLDPAYARLQENINGICVVDWATHARRDDSVLCTYPAGLASEVETNYGLDVIGKCDDHRPKSAQEHIAFRDKLIDRARRKTALASHLLKRENWDFFLTVFYEAHCIGHQAWHVHDSENADHDPALSQVVGDPVKDVYIAIDACMGELLEQIDEETMVIVFVSHGMQSHYTGANFLDDILAQLENTKETPVRKSAGGIVRKAWVNAPAPVRKALMPLRRGVVHQLADKKNRKYFEVINNFATAGIRVNLAGRERNGMVQPGEEYDTLCQELIEALSAFTNPDNGEPLFEEILKTSDLYEGDFLHELPDLLARWNRPIPINRAYSPKTGLLENTHGHSRTGDHTPWGMFFAVGPSIGHRALNRTVACIDFAPTISTLLGVDFQGFDGQRIGELCET